MTTIGKSIITIKRDQHNNIPDLTVENDVSGFTMELGQRKDGTLDGNWDLTNLSTPITELNGKTTPYKYFY